MQQRQAAVPLPSVGSAEHATRRRTGLNTTARRYLTFLLLVAPVVVLRLVTTAYPIVNTVSLSTTNSSLLSGTSQFIGLDNYRAMVSDFGIATAIRFTLAFVLGSTLLQLIAGLLVALLLNAKFRGRGFARSINLIPWAIPAIVAAYAFRWLLDDQFGLIPYWIHQLTGVRLAPLSSALSAQVSLILVNVWKNAPFMAVVFLAGLQGVPEDLYEAAKVDGANAVATFLGDYVPHDPAAPDRAGDVLRRLAAGRIRPDLRSDERRTRRGHGDVLAADLPGRVALLQVWLCLGRSVWS